MAQNSVRSLYVFACHCYANKRTTDGDVSSRRVSFAVETGKNTEFAVGSSLSTCKFRWGGGGGRTLGLFVKSFLPAFREKQHRNIFSHHTGQLAKFGWILTYLKISIEMAVTWFLPRVIQLLLKVWLHCTKHKTTIYYTGKLE